MRSTDGSASEPFDVDHIFQSVSPSRSLSRRPRGARHAGQSNARHLHELLQRKQAEAAAADYS